MASRSTAGTTKTPSNAKSDASDKGSKPELEIVSDTGQAEIAPAELKKQELLQLVADRAELNKNKIKPVLEAVLDVIGEAIAEGRELNLQPLGRVKINRQKTVGNARVTVAKIRQSKPKGDAGAE